MDLLRIVKGVVDLDVVGDGRNGELAAETLREESFRTHASLVLV